MRSIVSIEQGDRFKGKNANNHIKWKYTPIKSQRLTY